MLGEVARPYADLEVEVVRKTEEFVRQKLESESSGHDWWHVHRVRNNAVAIAAGEGASLYVVELAALLHDIADWKFHAGDLAVGPRVTREWLSGLDVDEPTVVHVSEIVATVSYKGAGVSTPMRTVEGMCVQDGDRLDAIGAIGIGRTFAYGGHTGRPMHDPEERPELHQSFEQYKNSKGPTTNHFYEKLLLLKERMNTDTARRLAEGRHEFMEEFLERFFAEWDGRA